MSSIILDHGQSDINVDFADVKTIMGHKGLALMGVGESQGTKAATEALQTAIESPLFDNMKIDGAMGVLVHFYIHPNYPLQDISDAMEHIEDNVDEDAQVIFGTTTDESLDQNTVKVTIVATGFEKDLNDVSTSHNSSRKDHYQQHQTKNRVEREKTPISSQPSRQTHQVKREVQPPVELKPEPPKINRTKISIPNNEDDLELPSYLRLGQGRN
jgi:cell division protein FtsZ